MWITRNKRDTYESDSLILWLDDEKPTRKDNGDGNYQYWFGICGIELRPYTKKWYDEYKHLTWDAEPIEVDLITKDDLIDTQKELKGMYLMLNLLQIKEIRNLTQVFRGIQLEEVSNIINDIEQKIHNKYEMIGDPSCSQNCRMVTIAHSSTQISDNSLREYINNDKVVATIYVRRNDFNTADILVSDLCG